MGCVSVFLKTPMLNEQVVQLAESRVFESQNPSPPEQEPQATQPSPFIPYRWQRRMAACPRSQLFSRGQGGLPLHLNVGTPNSMAPGVRHITEMRGRPRGYNRWGCHPMAPAT